MKTKILICLLFSFCLTTAQTKFKPGYFISNNQTTECLIKDEDWKTSPSEFEYKLGINSKVETRNKYNTEAFGIDGKYKFISALVEIDQSTDNVRRMGNSAKPEFKTEKLFLNVIVRGKASLYEYSGSNLKRYFYKLEGTEITQLIYKRYRPKYRTTRIAENNNYKQWILNNLTCEDIPISLIEKLNYKKKDLKEIFIKYNGCQNRGSTYIEENEKRRFFNFSFKGGLDFSNAKSVNTQMGQRNVDLGESTNFRYGIEAEFILPFRNNKWSIFLEPSLRSSSGSASVPREDIQGGFLNAEFEYKSFELPIGSRYFIFLNKKTQLFINAAYVFDFRSEDTFLAFTRSDGSNLGEFRDLRSKSNFFAGFGVKVFNRLSGEVRFYTGRPVLERFVRYNNTAVVIGFRIF